MMDVIASDCSAYGFGDQRSVEEGTVVTSKGGVKLRVYRERHDTRAGLYLFLHEDGFWYIVVMPKCLAARSRILGCIHFCI